MTSTVDAVTRIAREIRRDVVTMVAQHTQAPVVPVSPAVAKALAA
jgi:hypothetical protein